jgi:hypothetical protein
VVIVINNSDKQVGLYSGGLIFGGGGLIFRMRWALVHVVGLYTGGGVIFGGAYNRGRGLIFGGLRYRAVRRSQSTGAPIQTINFYCLSHFCPSGLVSMFACFSMTGAHEGYISMFCAHEYVSL